jgi:dTDP-glucose pyrophosphorylase
VNGKTHGAICTALLACEYIDSDEELIVMAVDDFIDADFRTILDFFRTGGCDAGLVSFNSAHPRYSFARLDEDGMVSETAEKRPISRHALASLYYFRRGGEFVECAKEVIRKDDRINNAFFISQAVNEMILQRRKVLLHPIHSSQFHPLKNEMQLAQYMTELKTRQEGV